MWHFSFVFLNEISRGGKKPTTHNKRCFFRDRGETHISMKSSSFFLLSLGESHFKHCNCNQCTAMYAQWRWGIPLLSLPPFFFSFSPRPCCLGSAVFCLGTLFLALHSWQGSTALIGPWLKWQYFDLHNGVQTFWVARSWGIFPDPLIGSVLLVFCCFGFGRLLCFWGCIFWSVLHM